MKKYFSIALAAFAILSLSIACNKEAPDPDDQISTNENKEDVTPAGEQITIIATLSDALTRVSFTPNTDGYGKTTSMSITWALGDQIRVYNHNDHSLYEDFTLDESAVGQQVGTFSGTAITADSYDVEVINETFDYNNQNQPSDGLTDNLKYLANASNIADYTDITFTEFSSVLAITAKMPSTAVAQTIKSIDMTASEAIFNGSKSLTITFHEARDAGNDGILHIFATLPIGDTPVPAGTTLLVHFNAPNSDHTVYTRFVDLGNSGLTFTANTCNTININATKSDQHAGLTSCTGSSADVPYLIGDKYQMDAMHNLLVAGSTKYFKMIDNVDLSGITWTPLNTASPYNKAFVFDGNDKTIDHLSSSGKYASFAGVLNGSVSNVSFENAIITTSAEKAGVVAGFLGSSGASVAASCTNITIKDSSVSGTGTNGYLGALAGIADCLSAPIDNCHAENVEVHGNNYIGGLLGCVKGRWTVKNCTSSAEEKKVYSTNSTSNADICLGGLIGDVLNGATISKCSSSVHITQTNNGRDIGGLIGRLQAGTVEKCFAVGNMSGQQRNVGGLVGCITNTSGTAIITDCYSEGTVYGKGGHSGGLVGLFEKGSLTIERCYAKGDVSGDFGLGGLIGFDGGVMALSQSAAWNTNVKPRNYGSANWSSGAVIGVAWPTAVLTDNYRNHNMVLVAWWVPAMDYSQPDVSVSSPLVVKDLSTGELRPTEANSQSNTQDNYPQFAYHGKVELGTGSNGANKTLSQLASTTLGWDSNVWNFTGMVPTLK